MPPWGPLVLVVVLVGVACADSEPAQGSCDTDGPPRISEACTFEESRDECERASRRGLDRLAEDLGAKSSRAEDIAAAFADNYLSEFHEAVFDGCLEGLGEDSSGGSAEYGAGPAVDWDEPLAAGIAVSGVEEASSHLAFAPAVSDELGTR